MFAIIVNPTTQRFIAAMNEGVAPAVEDEETYFVYHDHDTPSELLTSDEMSERLRKEAGKWDMLYFGIWSK